MADLQVAMGLDVLELPNVENYTKYRGESLAGTEALQVVVHKSLSGESECSRLDMCVCIISLEASTINTANGDCKVENFSDKW
jgi:hypothetical protein